MAEPLPMLLVPGLNCSARLYGAQIPILWRFGPVTVADHTRDDAMAAIARRILANAPPRFAVVGLSMGGYLALELLRQASDRVAKVALLDTAARADTPEQSARRDRLMELARGGRFAEVVDALLPLFLHTDRQDDEELKFLVRLMADETGPEAFIRQQTALKARADYRDALSSIHCPALVLVGEGDTLTPPERSEEIAAAIPGARLVVVPECGHLSTIERPEAVNRALIEWMEG
ncbi:MAG TPA: alpha/beta fold hydrolase [Xanthobacteraceae bacterium]|nr:alpha/beta fold hydrolase [Xanthobacteraceae bacterium]